MNQSDVAKKALKLAIETQRRGLCGDSYPFFNETLNDRWILEHVHPDKQNGYFLEAGAGDGVVCSSCFLLETERDWRGLCIEPNDIFFQKLVQIRPNSVCENVCLSNKSEIVTYVQGLEGLVSPFLGGIKENLQQFKVDSELILQKGKAVEKEALPLVDLLDRHKAPKVIDYAAFDIEGSEFKVLENFPFDRYIFLALTLECDASIWDNITELLNSKGYHEVKNPFNKEKVWERYWLHHSMPKSLLF